MELYPGDSPKKITFWWVNSLTPLGLLPAFVYATRLKIWIHEKYIIFHNIFVHKEFNTLTICKSYFDFAA